MFFNFFKGKRMNNKDDVEKEVVFFASQSESFYKNEIKKSVRWQEIDNEDKYIILIKIVKCILFALFQNS